ncbi:DUF1642 domain-containing protein [Bacillus inaquosorum]|uniref:hypothetical protein n=1 Tax=Bacillus inaquosorum TaxID=483913 RepID=UPI00227EA79A|nr:hypothetical protein [Bacillus inaquosorum]MCY7910944.1 DUF1642 domain-containing protein [Bacillus inaquosorum]
MKPTITKEQAEAIDSLRNGKAAWDDEDFLYAYTSADYSTSPEFQPIASMDLLTLAAALVNGYEVEKTPEEKVREYHRSLVCDMDRALSYEEEGNYRSAIEAVEETLNLLGIKIEGVNA